MSRGARYSLTSGLILLTLTLAPVSAHGQTPATRRVSLITGLAVTTQTDDETSLGRGALVSAGAATMATRHLRVEGEISIGRHERGGADAGRLEATGTPIVGTVRAAWLFGSPTSGARPFVSAGPMLTHSRGEFRWTPITPDPDGRPVEGPVSKENWRVTKPGFEVGLGLELRGKGRMWWRPELRFSGTQGNADYSPGADVLEIPILTLRGGLTVIW